MNATAVARHYGSLTPEERFRLILAASGRGDEAERDRLANAGQRIGLSVPCHWPFAMAFRELSTLTFLELLEVATLCAEANHALDIAGAGDEELVDQEGGGAAGPEHEPDAATSEAGPGEQPVWARALEHARAAAFILRTKAEGWKLFCSRLTVAPFLLWEEFPGFERLQRSLALADKTALTPVGFLRWLNTVRPAGTPDLSEVPQTAEREADAAQAVFRQRVASWQG